MHISDIIEVLIGVAIGFAGATYLWKGRSIQRAADRAADEIRKP